MLKQAMITWGSQNMLGNDADKKNAVAETAALPTREPGNHAKSSAGEQAYIAPAKPKKIPKLDDFEMINKSIFLKMFEKSLMHIGIRNAISLIEFQGALSETPPDSEFMRHYPDDAMTATFEVLKL